MRQNFELVGIVNVTPDSFSGDGLTETPEAVKRAERLFGEGASIVDIGAESTRPGAQPITHEEEWERLRPVLDILAFAHIGQVSVDTYHPETVEKTVRSAGNIIVNDVTAFNNPRMREVVAKLGQRCIVSHLPASVGQDIQAAHQEKKVSSVTQVLDELLTRRRELIEAGVPATQIILDPGIGFGKTPELNCRLLTFAQEVPFAEVMVGYSRKRFLGKDRMEIEPNVAAGQVAINAGAKYLRVHDVAGHYKALKKPRAS